MAIDPRDISIQINNNLSKFIEQIKYLNKQIGDKTNPDYVEAAKLLMKGYRYIKSKRKPEQLTLDYINKLKLI